MGGAKKKRKKRCRLVFNFLIFANEICIFVIFCQDDRTPVIGNLVKEGRVSPSFFGELEAKDRKIAELERALEKTDKVWMQRMVEATDEWSNEIQKKEMEMQALKDKNCQVLELLFFLLNVSVRTLLF